MSVLLLALLMVCTTAVSYVYWQGGLATVTPAQTGTDIVIGQAGDVSTEIDLSSILSSYGDLVPVGYAKAETDDVEEIVINFNVTWASSSTLADSGTTGVLTVVESFTNIAGLLNVAIDVPDEGAIECDGDPVAVTVTVTLSEPDDKSEYDAVKTQIIELLLTASIAVD